KSGAFRVAQALDTKPLEKIFQHKVLGMFIRLWRALAKRQDNGGSGKADHDVAAFGVQGTAPLKFHRFAVLLA
ncbi:MAG: hypothetical protein JRJ85_06695, partial [Deltaproteobacteria bacterium]|nr:hypothetical protein [Deltaproteobacteria bacterium]